MALDAATQNLLDTMRASGGKPVHETPLSELRPAIRTMSQQLGGPPVAVHSVTNRTVRGPSGEFGTVSYTHLTLPTILLV